MATSRVEPHTPTESSSWGEAPAPVCFSDGKVSLFLGPELWCRLRRSPHGQPRDERCDWRFSGKPATAAASSSRGFTATLPPHSARESPVIGHDRIVAGCNTHPRLPSYVTRVSPYCRAPAPVTGHLPGLGSGHLPRLGPGHLPGLGPGWGHLPGLGSGHLPGLGRAQGNSRGWGRSPGHLPGLVADSGLSPGAWAGLGVSPEAGSGIWGISPVRARGISRGW